MKTERTSQPDPKKVFTVLSKKVDTQPFLELFDVQSTETWTKLLDELMLVVVDAHASDDAFQFSAKQVFEMFDCARRLRDAFREADLETSSPTL